MKRLCVFTLAMAICLGNVCGVSAGDWVPSGDNIYYDAGRVGIGTTAPAYTFDVRGSFQFVDDVNGLWMLRTSQRNQSYAGGNPHNLKTFQFATYSQDSTGASQRGGLLLASPEVSALESSYIYAFTQHNLRIGTVDDGNRRAEIEIYNMGGGAPARGAILFRTGAWQDPSNVPYTSTNVRMLITNAGNVGIGTMEPQSKLAVNGTITTKEVVVTTEGWADYVFDDDYKLMPLAEVEKHIKTEKHLPHIPSAKEVKENGISLGDMQTKMMAKIEELTLHMIAQNKKLERLENENMKLKIEMTALQSRNQ